MATVKRLLNDIDNKIAAEKPAPKAEPKEKGAAGVPPHGFKIGKDGVYVPKEYSDRDMKKAYNAAIKHFRSGGDAMEFRDQHPEYNADAIMSAFNDYSKSSKPTAINPANVLKEAKTGKENPKLDHIKEYFSIWGNPGPREFDEVVKFYKLGDEDASELRKHFGYDKPKDSRKQLLGQMEGIRNEEKENERNLLKDFGNNAIPYDEFKNKQNQLHQEAQGRVDSLYGQLVGNGKTAPNEAAPAGLITRDNRGEFLKKNNYKNFYWDGNDLVYGPTGENVYLMPNSGVSEDELRKELDTFRPDPRDMRDEVRKIETELGTQIRDMASYDRVAKELMDRDLAISREQARNMVDEYIGADLAERINAEREDELTKYDGYAPVEPRRDNRINPRQVYENASNAEQEKTRSELAAREVEAGTPKEPGLRGAWQDEILQITDKNKQSFLDENGFDKDFYWSGNDLVSRKTGRIVYSLPPRAGAQSSLILKRMGYGSDAEKALTAKRNQARAELEKRTGRKYSDDEWAAIVELASQLR